MYFGDYYLYDVACVFHCVATNKITIPANSTAFRKHERKGTVSLQTNIVKQIANIVSSSSLAESVTPRLKRFLLDRKIDAVAMEKMVHGTIKLTRCLLPSVGLSIIKTLTNAWTTDRRMSNPTSPCQFGCRKSPSNDDSLDHYLKCQKLHRPVTAFI